MVKHFGNFYVSKVSHAILLPDDLAKPMGCVLSIQANQSTYPILFGDASIASLMARSSPFCVFSPGSPRAGLVPLLLFVISTVPVRLPQLGLRFRTGLATPYHSPAARKPMGEKECSAPAPR